jgi:uncharacterized RDD family membrane protein YckC
VSDPNRPEGPLDQPAGEPPAPDQPAGDQPTTTWTTPEPPPPPPPSTPTPSGEPAPPYSTRSGPLLSATPTSATGWTQPVQTAPGGREVAPGLVFSGTAARFAALVTDSFLLGLVTSAISATIGSGSSFTQNANVVWTTADFLASIIAVTINGVYFVAFWSGGRRATLGQMLFKIQVGNAFDGEPLTTEQAIRRWLGLGQFLSAFAFSVAAVGLIGVLSLVWSLVLFISTVSSPTKQGLHDRFANSAVVRQANAGNGLVYACLTVVFILPVLAIVAIVALIFLSGQVSDILSAVGTSV